MAVERVAELGAQSGSALPRRRRWPPEAGIFLVLVGMALAFELLGWILVGQSFLLNGQRLQVMILQVAVTGKDGAYPADLGVHAVVVLPPAGGCHVADFSGVAPTCTLVEGKLKCK